MAERRFGPYQLVHPIAIGGMAEIYLARTKGFEGFEKYVALKMILPHLADDQQFIQMLVDEANIAVQLTHGNIAQTFDLGRVGTTYYITMEYVDGADLRHVLEHCATDVPIDVCAYVGMEIATGLEHAHRKTDHAGRSLGIVHRDVTPHNVLVSYGGEVKLIDFGIAKARAKRSKTAAGVIKGKYYYMSPEQARGEPIDHRSDIFSTPHVLNEILPGRPVHTDEDLHSMLEAVRDGRVDPPSRTRRNIPAEIDRIVMRALAVRVADRYQNAGDLGTDLGRFLRATSPRFSSVTLGAWIVSRLGEPARRLSTGPIRDAEIVRAREEISHDHSMIGDPKPRARKRLARSPEPDELEVQQRAVTTRSRKRTPRKETVPRVKPRRAETAGLFVGDVSKLIFIEPQVTTDSQASPLPAAPRTISGEQRAPTDPEIMMFVDDDPDD